MKTERTVETSLGGGKWRSPSEGVPLKYSMKHCSSWILSSKATDFHAFCAVLALRTFSQRSASLSVGTSPTSWPLNGFSTLNLAVEKDRADGFARCRMEREGSSSLLAGGQWKARCCSMVNEVSSCECECEPESEWM